MFHGPPLPLSPDVPLSDLLAYSHPPGQLGAWIRGSTHRLHIHKVPPSWRCPVLASTDLGFLLGRCEEVAVREGERTIVLASEAVIQWRALQVATAMPYLPGLERLRAVFPQLRASWNGLQIPIPTQSPEEVLARCLAEGIQITGSRIVYGWNDGTGGGERLP